MTTIFLLLVLFSTSGSSKEIFKEHQDKADKKKKIIEERIKKTVEEKDFEEKLYDHPAISTKYFRGSYLIYDCENRHFACVDVVSYWRCQDQREEDKKKHLSILGCAPLKKFATFKECATVNYHKIHAISSKAFCINIEDRNK